MGVRLFTKDGNLYMRNDHTNEKVVTVTPTGFQVGDSTAGVNLAAGSTKIYGYNVAKTTAVTGTVRGVRGNARANIASAAGTFRGGDFQAGNGTTIGVAAGTLEGVFAEAVLKAGSAGAHTIAAMRGLVAGLDANGDANATVTAGRAIYAYVRSGLATLTASCVAFLQHEAVAGAGKTLTAFIVCDSVAPNGGANALVDASTAKLTATGDEITLIAFKDSAGGAKKLVYDVSDAAVKVI
jgi:hypothetical protein